MTRNSEHTLVRLFTKKLQDSSTILNFFGLAGFKIAPALSFATSFTVTSLPKSLERLRVFIRSLSSNPENIDSKTSQHWLFSNLLDPRAKYATKPRTGINQCFFKVSGQKGGKAA